MKEKKVTSNPNFVTSDRRKDQASEIRNGDITCNSLSQQTMSNEIEVDRNLFLYWHSGKCHDNCGERESKT